MLTSITGNVLLPYKFTLLSNNPFDILLTIGVLLPYKFTLLSNEESGETYEQVVLLPYKFTLLSNLKFGKATLLAVHLQGRNYHYNITFLIVSQLYHA